MTDHLGSTEALTDASGAIVSSTSYDSFGNATSNIQTSYRYTGREYDSETGLYYYRNRWYDPEIGLFISEDPIGFAGGDINLYSYVWNSPYNFIDPFGENPALLLKVAIGLGSYLLTNPPYLNAPGPGDPVYSPGGNASLGDAVISGALGLVGGAVLGRFCVAVGGDVVSGVSKAAGAAGRGIQKAAKSVTKSKVPATKGLTKFDDATTLAAGRLGFDPSDIVVKNGVADIPIIFTSKVSPKDITAVTNALKGQGVNSVRINTGPIINPSITSRLENAANSGKSFLGFNVRRTNDPENPFVLDKGI